jgi:penicillin-binding protein 2
MADLFSIEDHTHEQRVFRRRLLFVGVVALLMVGGLIARYFFLQVTKHAYYKTASDENRIQLLAIAPSRGLIFDSQGVVLADNSPSFALTIVKEQVENKNIDETIIKIRKIIDIDDRDIAKFKVRLKERQRPYEPVALKFNLTDEEIAKISVNTFRLPGIDIEAEMIRRYPLSDLTAHSVGYVGRINETEANAIDEVAYNGTHYIGKVGVEKSYEDILHGEVGYQQVETNVHGQVLRTLGKTDSVAGKNLQLYLDSRLQDIATKALGQNKGAVVAIDPKTGGILAFVSTPSYDPNLFVTGISSADYKKFNEEKALYNRALRGEYAPGSTVKPLFAVAGLESGKIDPDYKISDPGFFQLGGKGRIYNDWKKGGHGIVDLHTAIVESCDVYFYELARKLTINGIDKYLSQFGLGKKTRIDLPEERPGVLPSPEWKQKRFNQPWFPGETISAGIGQGYMLVTPLQMATALTMLVNRGQWVQPRIVKTVLNHDRSELPESEWVTENKREPFVMHDPALWQPVLDAMQDVVHGEHGTAKKIGVGAPYKMAGKTGTAQVFSLNNNEKYNANQLAKELHDHAWFIGYAPAENPTIVVAIIVENGGHGGSTAAPIARQLFDMRLLGIMPTPAPTPIPEAGIDE